MAVNVTPEVAEAHNELRIQCEKFEAAVDNFCASSPQSLTHDFYASGCIPIAAACADALSEFSNARSYEDTACEQEIQDASSQAQTRIREAEERKQEAERVGAVEFKNASNREHSVGCLITIPISIIICWTVAFLEDSRTFWGPFIAGILVGIPGSPIVYFAYHFITKNMARTKKDQAEQLAGREFKQVEAEQKRKVDEVTSSARSNKDQAVAYIEREYQDFNMRLCQCLDKLQPFVDAWTTENANVTSVLDEIDVQDLGKTNERIAPRLTRVGTVGFHIAGRV